MHGCLLSVFSADLYESEDGLRKRFVYLWGTLMVSIEKKFGYPPETFYISSRNHFCTLRKPFMYPPETVYISFGIFLNISSTVTKFRIRISGISHADSCCRPCRIPSVFPYSSAHRLQGAGASCKALGRRRWKVRHFPLKTSELSPSKFGTSGIKVRHFFPSSLPPFPHTSNPFGHIVGNAPESRCVFYKY